MLPYLSYRNTTGNVGELTPVYPKLERERESGSFRRETKSSSSRKPDKAWSSAASAEEKVEWIVTFKPVSGIIVKVEKLHSESGERQELSIQEYGALAAMGAPVTVPRLPGSADALPATNMSRLVGKPIIKAFTITLIIWLNSTIGILQAAPRRLIPRIRSRRKG